MIPIRVSTLSKNHSGKLFYFNYFESSYAKRKTSLNQIKRLYTVFRCLQVGTKDTERDEISMLITRVEVKLGFNKSYFCYDFAYMGKQQKVFMYIYENVMQIE